MFQKTGNLNGMGKLPHILVLIALLVVIVILNKPVSCLILPSYKTCCSFGKKNVAWFARGRNVTFVLCNILRVYLAEPILRANYFLNQSYAINCGTACLS